MFDHPVKIDVIILRLRWLPFVFVTIHHTIHHLIAHVFNIDQRLNVVQILLFNRITSNRLFELSKYNMNMLKPTINRKRL